MHTHTHTHTPTWKERGALDEPERAFALRAPGAGCRAERNLYGTAIRSAARQMKRKTHIQLLVKYRRHRDAQKSGICFLHICSLKEISYVHQSCIFFFKYSKIITNIYFCIIITPGFTVTWFYWNHSNMLLKKYFWLSMSKAASYFKSL